MVKHTSVKQANATPIQNNAPPHLQAIRDKQTGQATEMLQRAPVKPVAGHDGYAPEIGQVKAQQAAAEHDAEQAAIAAARAATGEPDPTPQLAEMDQLKARVARLEQSQGV